MAKRLREAKSKSLLVFVHGYNMSFAETAMRTAQLAYDLNFPGIPFFFSWPSAGQLTGYLRDAETAQLSEDAFDQVLDDLSRLPVERRLHHRPQHGQPRGEPGAQVTRRQGQADRARSAICCWPRPTSTPTCSAR